MQRRTYFFWLAVSGYKSILVGKAWSWESEVVGHIVSAVRRHRGTNPDAQLFFLLFIRLKNPRPKDRAFHIQGRSSPPVKSSWIHPYRHIWRCAFLVIPNPIKFRRKINIAHATSLLEKHCCLSFRNKPTKPQTNSTIHSRSQTNVWQNWDLNMVLSTQPCHRGPILSVLSLSLLSFLLP